MEITFMELGKYYEPEIFLSSWYAFNLLNFLNNPTSITIFIVDILQMRKLRNREVR